MKKMKKAKQSKAPAPLKKTYEVDMDYTLTETFTVFAESAEEAKRIAFEEKVRFSPFATVVNWTATVEEVEW